MAIRHIAIALDKMKPIAALLLALIASTVAAQERGVSASPADFIAVGGQVFFTAETRTHGRELWRTDGTTDGTRLVRDLTPGYESSYLESFVAGEGVIYFVRRDGTAAEVWKSDGTESGTMFLHRGPRLGGFSILGATRNGIVFRIDRELWVADGPHSEALQLRMFTDTSEAVTLNGITYFYASDQNAPGVWRTDGTETGTAVHFRYTDAGHLFAFRGSLYFFSFVGGYLWRLPEDGPAVQIAILGSAYLRSFGELGDWLFLMTSYSWDQTATLWKTDGTAAGTSMVETLGLITTSWPLVAAGRHLFFVRQATGTGSYGFLAVSDGTPAGTRDLVSIIAPGYGGQAALNGRLLFDAFMRPGVEETRPDLELWSSDGTPEGTILVRDIAPGIASSSPRHLLAWRDMVLFTANDHIYGEELWRTDGTAAGTRLVANIAGEGVVEGRISDAATDEALANVIVEIYMEFFGGRRLVTAVTSDANGRYRIDGLRTGAYQVRTRNTLGYLDQTGVRPVAFPLAPTTISGYDFALRRGGPKRRAI